MKLGFFTSVAIVSLGLATGASPAGPSYQVVVNHSRGASQLSRSQVADFLLKRVSNWPDGMPVAAVDLSSTSPVRVAFSREILGKSVETVVQYWQQQIFSGRGTPPHVKSEQDILALVASTPGAIGYVGGEASLPTGVKTLKLTN